MEIDTSLPSRWNVIKRNEREYNDPWSYHRFGTISRVGSRTPSKSNTFNNINIQRNNDECNQYMSEDDCETLGSNDSIRSEAESEYSDDIEFINKNNTNDITSIPVHENDISIKCAEITNENNNNNKHILQLQNDNNNIDWVTSFNTNNNKYAIENYNYTDWIVNNDNEDMFANDEFYEVITEKDIANDKKAVAENEEYLNRIDLNEEKRNMKYKGHIHLREIRRYQKGYGLLISKEEFVSFIGNIMFNIQSTNTNTINIPMELSSIHPLQKEAEAKMIELFEDAQLFAIHSGRQSVNETDIKAVLKLRQQKWEHLKWLNIILAKFNH